MRGHTNQIWSHQSEVQLKKKKNHQVNSYIYSERVSFPIAFQVISELLQLSMELHVNIRKCIEKATCSLFSFSLFPFKNKIRALHISHCLWQTFPNIHGLCGTLRTHAQKNSGQEANIFLVNCCIFSPQKPQRKQILLLFW